MNPSESNSLISLDYINMMSDGDQEFVLGMLQTFLENVDNDIDRLRKCLGLNDKNELREISHKLKGSAQIFEAKIIVDILKSIEHSCVDDTQVIDTVAEINESLRLLDIMKEEVKSKIQSLS